MQSNNIRELAMKTQLEHINISVPNARATAAFLSDLFGWHIRWEGPAIADGYSIHVGSDDTYLALYTPSHEMKDGVPRYRHWGGLNHIGLVVEDLEAVENSVRAAGYTPHSHADYEPGRRFYFDGPDGVEYEIVSYDA